MRRLFALLAIAPPASAAGHATIQVSADVGPVALAETPIQ